MTKMSVKTLYKSGWREPACFADRYPLVITNWAIANPTRAGRKGRKEGRKDGCPRAPAVTRETSAAGLPECGAASPPGSELGHWGEECEVGKKNSHQEASEVGPGGGEGGVEGLGAPVGNLPGTQGARGEVTDAQKTENQRHRGDVGVGSMLSETSRRCGCSAPWLPRREGRKKNKCGGCAQLCARLPPGRSEGGREGGAFGGEERERERENSDMNVSWEHTLQKMRLFFFHISR